MKTFYFAISLQAFVLPSVTYAGCPATCNSNGLTLSCHNSSAIKDTCCFNAAGSLLQTQFWDYNPATGPANSWTVHGLWPDYCDGSYPATCDNSRQYKNISQILESFGQQDLLSYMRSNWKDQNGDDESFWEHEWGKHGTCVSTLKPSCYSDYTPQEEVVDYFTRTVSLYKSLDTYSFLQKAGIVPSSSRNYTLKSVQSALSAAPGRNGTSPYIGCDDDGAINQVYYYFNVLGSTQTGQFVAASPDNSDDSSCPDSVRYLPKKNGTQPHSSSVSSQPRATASLDGSCRLNSKWPAKYFARSFSS